MYFLDDSPVHPHPEICDKARWSKGSDDDDEVTWPRVSISMAAKAVEDNSGSFTYIAQSIPCGEETRRVSVGPEVREFGTIFIVFFSSLLNFFSSTTQWRSSSRALFTASSVS
jgi:hypothetical protein